MFSHFPRYNFFIFGGMRFFTRLSLYFAWHFCLFYFADAYLNTDAWMMSSSKPREVFVLDDSSEVRAICEPVTLYYYSTLSWTRLPLLFLVKRIWWPEVDKKDCDAYCIFSQFWGFCRSLIFSKVKIDCLAPLLTKIEITFWQFYRRLHTNILTFQTMNLSVSHRHSHNRYNKVDLFFIFWNIGGLCLCS